MSIPAHHSKWISIWLIALAVIVIAVASYMAFFNNKKVVEDKAVETISATLDEIESAPAVTVPSANPADRVAPTVNPIEKANPFNDEYENPFE